MQDGRAGRTESHEWEWLTIPDQLGTFTIGTFPEQTLLTFYSL